jgi:sulfatase maturation enzyme AslB (radical SAM superfamily)
MQNELDKLPENYCYFSMQGYSTHAHGRTRPCCFSRVETNAFMPSVDIAAIPDWKHDNNWNSENIEDFINDPQLKEIRSELLKNKKPKGCEGCFKLEDQGIRSFRQTWNEIYKDHIDTSLQHVSEDGHLDPKSITYLDISLGNVCNLKCRSCNPWASHRWIEEGPTVPHTDWDATAYLVGKMSSVNPWFVKAFKEGFFDDALPNVRVINFIGGEPLVVEEHYAWLEHIVEQGWSQNIELHYNTNGTTIPNRLLDIWDKFRGVVLSLSIDAIGDLAYYVRFPSKWRVIQKNIEKLKEFSRTRTGVIVHTHVTLSMLNLHDLPNILDWCKENYDTWHYVWDWGNHGYQNCLPHFNIVDHPPHLNIRNLPDDRKVLMNQMLEEQYNKFKGAGLPDWEQWAVENIINLKNILNQEPNDGDWQVFIDNTNASDKFRGVDIVKYIPWMEGRI